MHNMRLLFLLQIFFRRQKELKIDIITRNALSYGVAGTFLKLTDEQKLNKNQKP